MKVCLCAGGTGGHIYPAIAFAKACQLKGWDVIYYGNKDKMEGLLTQQHGIPFESVSAKSMTGNYLNKLLGAGHQAFALFQALSSLRKHQPDIILGFGGFVSAPVVIAGHLLKIPVLLHEQNAIAGKANLTLQRYAKGVVTCYLETNKQFHIESRCLGNPRATVAAMSQKNPNVLSQLGLSANKPIVLIVMGSLGSQTVNQILKEFSILAQSASDIQFIIALGRRFFASIKDEFAASDHVLVVDYIEQIELLPYVSLMVSRAGATSAAEVLALGVPSILIPSPYVPNNHQYHNACELTQSNAAVMMEEKDLTAHGLLNLITELIHDQNRLIEMGKHAKTMAFPNAIDDMMTWVELLVKK